LSREAVVCHRAGHWFAAAAAATSGGQRRVSRRKRKQVKLGWMIAATHQFAEGEARANLVKLGFECDFPEMRLPINSRGVRRTVPLFEGYVFVRESDAWWSIRGTRGVSSLLMGCEKPSTIDDDTLQFFLSDSVDASGYYIDPVMKMHRVGDFCVPRSGRFRGVSGQLTRMQADGRIEMLFSLLGREVRTKEYQVTDLAS
jgi:transcription antitermination factor NusG